MRVHGSFVIVAGMLASCQVEAPSESSTTQLVVTTSPGTAFTFPATQVGQTSSAHTITVSPGPGENYDTITSITASCPGFAVSTPGLPAYVYRDCDDSQCPYPYATIEQCPEQPASIICNTIDYNDYRFTATFRPTIATDYSCVVRLYNGGSLLRSYSLSGTGTPVPIDIDVAPTSIAFGQVRRGTSSTPATITVRNLGGQTLAVSSVSVGAGFAITSGPTASYNLAAGGSQAYAVTCDPTAVGGLSGSFRVTSNDPSTPTVTIPLSCTGIDSDLGISPSPATIPPTRVGEPVERVITLANNGGASMTVEGVTLTGTGLAMVTAPPGGTVLGPGASTTARVAFGATATGEASGTLVVAYDGGQTRSVEISAVALATSMSLTPDGAVDLGPVCVGQSAAQTFTVVATDQGSFVVDQISSPTAPFTVEPGTLPATVQGAGANEVSFTITVAPTDPGVAGSTFSVMTDIPGSIPREISLSVEGLAAGVSATPALVDFGSHAIDTTTIGQEVVITNCGTEPVTLANVRIEGVDAAAFTVVQAPPSLTIAPAEKASFLVVASVRSVGVLAGTFVTDATTASAPAPTIVSAELAVEGLGEGIGTDDVDDAGRASYYACSSSSGHAAWPIGLALALLVRRRRRR